MPYSKNQAFHDAINKLRAESIEEVNSPLFYFAQSLNVSMAQFETVETNTLNANDRRNICSELESLRAELNDVLKVFGEE